MITSCSQTKLCNATIATAQITKRKQHTTWHNQEITLHQKTVASKKTTKVGFIPKFASLLLRFVNMLC